MVSTALKRLQLNRFAMGYNSMKGQGHKERKTTILLRRDEQCFKFVERRSKNSDSSSTWKAIRLTLGR